MRPFISPCDAPFLGAVEWGRQEDSGSISRQTTEESSLASFLSMLACCSTAQAPSGSNHCLDFCMCYIRFKCPSGPPPPPAIALGIISGKRPFCKVQWIPFLSEAINQVPLFRELQWGVNSTRLSFPKTCRPALRVYSWPWAQRLPD